MRASRDEWAKRVERWRDSGLSAEPFATELGISRVFELELARVDALGLSD